MEIEMKETFFANFDETVSKKLSEKIKNYASK